MKGKIMIKRSINAVKKDLRDLEKQLDRAADDIDLAYVEHKIYKARLELTRIMAKFGMAIKG